MRALIAMSGGVDSSVAAVLMQEAGHECIGATMHLFHNEDAGIPRAKTCCSLDDVQDAKLVAAKRGMLHYVFNFGDAFREHVMAPFVEDYAAGRTPSPCIECNRWLKFDVLMRRMEELRCDCIVTGHYARSEYDPASGRWLLRTAADTAKDQTYYLYKMTQAQLAAVRFPLGGMQKAEVRETAIRAGLDNARKRDSQDICFVPDGDHAAFIERFAGHPWPHGEIVDTEGHVLGEHQGIIRYTIGQRKGLGIAAGRPLYVCRIDAAQNRVIVGDDAALWTQDLFADELNMIAVPEIVGEMRVTAKIRSRHQAAPATAWMEDGRLHVRFDEPQRAVTPGQAVVLYQDDIVIGGGRIV